MRGVRQCNCSSPVMMTENDLNQVELGWVELFLCRGKGACCATTNGLSTHTDIYIYTIYSYLCQWITKGHICWEHSADNTPFAGFFFNTLLLFPTLPDLKTCTLGGWRRWNHTAVACFNSPANDLSHSAKTNSLNMVFLFHWLSPQHHAAGIRHARWGDMTLGGACRWQAVVSLIISW